MRRHRTSARWNAAHSSPAQYGFCIPLSGGGFVWRNRGGSQCDLPGVSRCATGLRHLRPFERPYLAGLSMA